jgi:hypothetical protein
MAVAVASTAAPVQGQCVMFDDRAEMFRLADAVFIGTVRKSEPTGVRGFHVVMHRASFEIDRVWKGQVKRLETIGTVEAFEPGTRYVVFATTGVPRALQSSLECGWAERASENGRNLQWLAEKVSRIPPTESK